MLNALFTLSIPEETEPVKQRSCRCIAFGNSKPIPWGRAEAIAGTIRSIGLSKENAHTVAQLVFKTPMNTVDDLIDAMTETGYEELGKNTIGTGRVFEFMENW